MPLDNVFSMKNSHLLETRMSVIRVLVVLGFYIVFQILILFQMPFLQIDFLMAFYVSAILLFGGYLIQYTIKSKGTFALHLLELFCVFYLFKSQPQYSSFYLIILLILLFLSCLELSEKSGLLLITISSLGINFINLFYLRWDGLQNIFNLFLFQFSFISVFFFASQIRFEIYSLNKELTVSNKKLKTKEELSAALIQQMPVGVVAVDRDQNIFFSNNYFKNQLHLSNEFVHQLNDDKNGLSNYIWPYYHPESKNKKFYQIQKSNYFDSELDQKIDLILVHDTTEMRLLQEKVQQKEKLAAIGQLAAGIAHEIRNPLAGISGSIQLLSSEAKNPDDQKLMKIILKEIDRLNLLITDFLDYSKPEKKPDQKIDLAFVVDECIHNIKLSAHFKEGFEIISHIYSVQITGHTHQLKQAFLNILMNSVQAARPDVQLKINIDFVDQGNFLLVNIKDNGQGMNEEVQKRLFEPFYTTKSKGTGLGMAITHKIFESHGVDVKINSEVGIGTEFILTFKKEMNN